MIKSITDVATAMLRRSRLTAHAAPIDADQDGTMTVSLRMPPSLKAHYDLMATQTHMTSNGLMVLTLAGAMAAEVAPVESAVKGIAGRWLTVHQWHGLSYAEIAALYPGVITLATLADDQQLLTVLGRDVLAKTAKLFNVSLKWLETGAGHVTPLEHRWYKSASQVASRLTYLAQQGYRATVLYLRSRSGRFDVEDDDQFDTNDSLAVVIAVPVEVQGVSYQRYEFWGAERWTYSKAQAEACALLRLTDLQPLPFQAAGYRLNADVFDGVINGDIHISEIADDLKWGNAFDPAYLYNSAKYNAYSDDDFKLLEPYAQITQQLYVGTRPPKGLPDDATSTLQLTADVLTRRQQH